MQITKDTVASIEYTLTDDAGEVLDTSKGREPLSYLHGVGGILPGLEAELEGKAEGDAFQVAIPPENGYGERNEGLVQAVPREQLPADVEVQIGMRFQARTPTGTHVLAVTAVEGDRVVLDANHPLAGATLHFDVRVVEVRPATPEELAHGHVHAGDEHGR